MGWASRTYQELLGAPYMLELGYYFLERKDIPTFHIPYVAVDGGLICLKTQDSPLWGELVFDASGCAKDKLASGIWNGQ